MNKTKFVETLSEQTKYTQDECYLICKIIEEHFFFRKENQETIKREFESKLEISETDAEELYEQIMEILKKEIKRKIKHPFGKH